jgi:hypothetical protein
VIVEQSFDNANWRDADASSSTEMAHLIGAMVEAATTAVGAVDGLRAIMVQAGAPPPGNADHRGSR